MDLSAIERELSQAFARGTAAGLHIDAQVGFIKHEGCAAAFQGVADVSAIFRDAGVTNYWAAITAYNRMLRFNDFEALNHGLSSAIHDVITVDPHDIVFEKHGQGLFESAYSYADLVLKSHGVDTLILTGVLHYACVVDTARGALENGYRVLVAKEATDYPSWRRWDYKDFILRDMEGQWEDRLDIVSLDMIYKALPGTACRTAPDFSPAPR